MRASLLARTRACESRAGVLAAPPALGFGRGLYKRKNERFFPPRKCQGGPLLFWLFYRGICPSHIKQACVFQKCPQEAPIFFIYLQQKISAFHRGIFFTTKTKIPPRKCQSWSKKGAALTPAVWVENRRSRGSVRISPDVPGLAVPPDPARSRFLPRRSRGRHS